MENNTVVLANLSEIKAIVAKDTLKSLSTKEPLVDGVVVVGLDPAAYRNNGWSIVKYENGKPILLKKYTQLLVREPDDFGRLEDVTQEFEKIVEEFKPSVLCLERSFGGGMANVRANMNEIIGVVKLICYRKGLKVAHVSPGHLKLVIAGHGKATKSFIKKNIVAEFDLKSAGAEHECDAAGFALCYLIDNGYTGYTVHQPFIGKAKKKQSKTKKVA